MLEVQERIHYPCKTLKRPSHDGYVGGRDDLTNGVVVGSGIIWQAGRNRRLFLRHFRRLCAVKYSLPAATASSCRFRESD